MGRRKRRKEKRSIQNPAVPLTNTAIMQYLGGGGRARSGVNVNWKTALTVSPIWQALNLITGDISRIPFVVHRSLDRGKEEAVNHPVYSLLRKHTGHMTSNLWIARMLGHALMYGNAFSRIHWRGARVRRLEWLHRDNVIPEMRDGRKVFLVQYTQDEHGRDGIDVVEEDDMFHLVGLTVDQLGGLSLIDYARHSIGRTISTEHYADDFFANDATPSGWFEHPNNMSEPAQRRFIEGVVKEHGGAGKRFRPGILEEGMTWKTAGVSPQDAMLIENMKWGVKDASRFFNIPPHKLGDSDKVAYKSLEEENKAYFDSSLGIWTSRMEFEASYKLFHERTEKGYFAQFAQDEWNKASTEARFKTYGVALQWGIFSRNEVRIRENLQPVEGGDEFPPMHQLGGAPAAGEQEREDDTEESQDDQEDETPADRMITREDIARRDLLSERLKDAFRLVGNAATRATKSPQRFGGLVNDLESRFSCQVKGKIEAAVSASVGDHVETISRGIFSRCTDQLLTASECTPDQLTERVTDTVAGWNEMAANWATDLIFERTQDD